MAGRVKIVYARVENARLRLASGQEITFGEGSLIVAAEVSPDCGRQPTDPITTREWIGDALEENAAGEARYADAAFEVEGKV